MLFTTVGFAGLPERFRSALDPTGKFSLTSYDFPTLIEVSKKIVRQALQQSGGRIETDASGGEVFVIPVLAPKPSCFEQSYKAAPERNIRFTADEQQKIKPSQETN